MCFLIIYWLYVSRPWRTSCPPPPRSAYSSGSCPDTTRCTGMPAPLGRKARTARTIPMRPCLAQSGSQSRPLCDTWGTLSWPGTRSSWHRQVVSYFAGCSRPAPAAMTAGSCQFQFDQPTAGCPVPSTRSHRRHHGCQGRPSSLYNNVLINYNLMDIPEQRYRKLVSSFRPLLLNVISEYPISPELQLPATRNLKYIIDKEKYSYSMPFALYAEFPHEIKTLLNDPAIEARVLGVRLIRALPFHYRVKTIEEAENELSTFMLRQGRQAGMDKRPEGQPSTPEYHYEGVADMVDLLMSVYEITGLSEQIYYDVNQKISAITSHIVQKCFAADRNVARNCYQALRALFLIFSECRGRATNKRNMSEEDAAQQEVQARKRMQQNKLINKIISLFNKSQSFSLAAGTNNSAMMASSLQNSSHETASTNPQLRQLILRTREYEARVRCRMLTGISYLLTYIPQYLPQIYELLSHQIFLILDNTNEFDINLQCFLSIKGLLALPLAHHLRVSIIKKWVLLVSELSNNYKKEYFPFYIQIMKEVSDFQFCPLRIRYFASTSFLEITRPIQQQLSRFIIYKFACRNLIAITNEGNAKSPATKSANNIKSGSNIKSESNITSTNIIFNIYSYDWFISRVRQQNQLFGCEFLISLLHAYFSFPGRALLRNKNQIKDLLNLCNTILDWNCSCKQETHIPTIKFSFDMYLQFLKQAARKLGNEIENDIKQLIQRCNGSNMYLLFKFKLIATFIRLDCYTNHIIPYSETKLNLDFLEGEAAPFMMPKNPKPIFDYDYSLTVDGEIESRKEIEMIKVIMQLLTAVEEVYRHQEDIVEIVNNMVIRYHEYLSSLEMQKTCNKDLINCLQSLEADHYFTDCQRNFLLALIDDQDTKGNNIEYTLKNKIVYSPFQTFDSDQEYNIFGGMSPVHLKIRVLGCRSYTSVFIEAKKSQWVGLPEMKLVISSAIQIKEIPFESSIIEIKVDRSGLINFEAWTVEGTLLMLGSGSHRLNRKFKWLQVDHLSMIDGIRSKAYLSRQQIKGSDRQAAEDSTYLTYCFGEPLLMQIIYSKNQIVVTVNSKQVWMEIQELIGQMVEQLMDGSAEIIRN